MLSSSSLAVIGELLMHVRRGAIAGVHSLRQGVAEALEGIAFGDAKTSSLVGRRLDQLKLPEGVRVGAIVRGADGDAHIVLPEDDTVIAADDHVILFVPHKRLMRDGEKLFQVQPTFL